MPEKLLIVGAGRSGLAVASAVLHRGRHQLTGFVDDHCSDQKILVSSGSGSCFFKNFGSSKNLQEIVRREKLNAVVIAITHDPEPHLLNEIIKCHESGIKVYQMPDFYARLEHRVPVEHIRDQSLLNELSEPRHALYHLFFNAVNYVVSSLCFLVVLLPLLPLIALLIKLDSQGPVFYRQKRVGFRGIHFSLLKFRTMIHDADRTGDAWTLKGDERITRVGRWLRKFRIDELPQFINIFKGEMALIGPRPEAVDLVELFKKEIPYYEYRYLVRPGITGWAQVYYMNTCSVEGALRKLEYDLYWINNRSVWTDVMIILKSFKVIFTGFGAI